MKVFGVCPRLVERPNLDPAGNLVSEEPSGFDYVMASAQNAGHEIAVDYNSKSIEDLVNRITIFDPDVIALSLDTCLVNVGKDIVNRINKGKKRTSIVGGSHFLSGKVEPPFDFAVIGEGEHTFTELLGAISREETDFSNIRGISFIDSNGRAVTTPRRERISDLDSLTFPYRNAGIRGNKLEGSLVYPPYSKQQGYVSITASRGCNNSCLYCTNSVEWGNKVIYRTVENVIEEIEHVQNEFGTNLVFFNDLNFTSNHKWIVDFCNSIIDKGINLNWHAMSNISTAANPEILKLMRKAGCMKLLFGIETLTDKPQKYGTYEEVKSILSLSQSTGIINHGFFMVGLPSDDYESIVQNIPSISKLPLHSIRIAVYTPFSGTRDSNNYKILNPNLENYDGASLVFEHPSLTNEQCQELRKQITSKFYSSKEYVQRVDKFLRYNPHLKESFELFLGDKDV